MTSLATIGMPQSHTIDPEGDLVLILKSPNEKTLQEISSNTSQVQPLTRRNPPRSSQKEFRAKAAPTDEEILSMGPTWPDEIRIRVSSKHLMLASSVFKRLLKLGSTEGVKYGRAQLRLPDDNPTALLILMNLIHGQLRKIPEKVDMDTLIEISLLVGKYELVESTGWFADRWLSELETERVEKDTTTMLSWIWVSFVFEKSSYFRSSTTIAIQNLDKEVKPDDTRLPIPEVIFSRYLTNVDAILLSFYRRDKLSKAECFIDYYEISQKKPFKPNGEIQVLW